MFLHTGFKAPYKTYDFESLKGFWSYPWRQDLPGHTNLVPGPWGLCANFSGQVVEQHITGITNREFKIVSQKIDRPNLRHF